MGLRRVFWKIVNARLVRVFGVRLRYKESVKR